MADSRSEPGELTPVTADAIPEQAASLAAAISEAQAPEEQRRLAARFAAAARSGLLSGARSAGRGARAASRRARAAGRRVRVTGREAREDGRGAREDGRGAREDGRGARTTGRGAPGDGRRVRVTGREAREDGRGARITGRGAPGDGRGAQAAGRGAQAVGRGAQAAGRGAQAVGRGVWAAGRGAQAAGRGAQAAGRGGRAARHRVRAGSGWLAAQVVAMAPRLRVRDQAALRAQFPGRQAEEIADALIEGASRASAAVGGAVGAWAALPVPPAFPAEIATETLALVGIEIKLVAELHEAYGMPAPGNAVERTSAYVAAWAHRRGVFMVPGGLILTAGSPLARRLRWRLAARAGRSAFSLGPLFTGATLGAALNRRETRRLGQDVRADLRRLQAGDRGTAA